MAEKKKTEEKKEVIVGTLQKSVIESYIMANSRQNLSIYSERLLLKLVEIAQSQVFGLDFKSGSGNVRVDPNSLGTIVELNITDLMGDNESANYTYAKKAVQELMKVHHEHETPVFKNDRPVLTKDGRQVYRFEAHQLLNDVFVNARPGTIIVEVNRHTWAALLDFSKGFRRYDLLLAMKLSRTYSLRLYKLISEQVEPITFTIAELKEKFGIEEKYKKTTDILRLLEASRKELDKYCSPWSFTVRANYSVSSDVNTGRVGRKAITSVTLLPEHRLKYDSLNARQIQAAPAVMLGKDVTDKLVKYFNFTKDEMNANMPLLMACSKNFGKAPNDRGPCLFDFLEDISPSALRAGNVKGYVVNALKKHLKERYHLTFVKGKILRDEPDLFSALEESITSGN